MNKQRRKELGKAVAILNDALGILEDICAEEQDAYDNLPDGIRDGERGEEMSGYIDSMEEQKSAIEDAISAIEDIVG